MTIPEINVLLRHAIKNYVGTQRDVTGALVSFVPYTFKPV